MHHLNAFGQGDDAGDVGGTEVELRTVVGEERRVTAAFVLGQDVDLALELGVRGARSPELARTWPRSTSVTVDAAEQQRRCCRQPRHSSSLLVEHLDGPVTVVVWVVDG